MKKIFILLSMFCHLHGAAQEESLNKDLLRSSLVYKQASAMLAYPELINMAAISKLAYMEDGKVVKTYSGIVIGTNEQGGALTTLGFTLNENQSIAVSAFVPDKNPYQVEMAFMERKGGDIQELSYGTTTKTRRTAIDNKYLENASFPNQANAVFQDKSWLCSFSLSGVNGYFVIVPDNDFHPYTFSTPPEK